MRIGKKIAAFISDERGGESFEYAIVAGLITVAAIAVIGKFGMKVVSRWTAVGTSL